MTKAILSRKGPISEELTSMVDSMPGAAFVSRATGTGGGEILYANKELLRLYGCESLEELLDLSNSSYIGLVYPDDVDSAKWFIAEHTKKLCDGSESEDEQTFRMQHRIQTKDHRIIEVVEIARYINDAKLGELVYSMQLRPSIELAAGRKDILTGLPNMRAFLDYAEKTTSRNRREDVVRPVNYIYFNLAHFKRYNIRHGLDDGDVFLRKVADILQHTFENDFTACFGADHFGVLTLDDAFEEQVREAHAKIAKIRPEATVELKAGIYRADTQKTDIAVNAACDLAKIACDSITANPNQYIRIYDDNLAKKVEQQSYITENLDRAIANGWIKVYYQPVVRSISNALCGFEALTRWVDPVYGFMNPAIFIHTLEESHLIHKLDIYVVQQVCRKLQSEIEAGKKPVPVSFNLSRLDFMLCDCFNTIEQIVLSCNVPRDLVRIEITESTVMEDEKRMSDEIARFRNAGYQVWMDDFGSGYSSLNMLKDFHFDELKLDMEFLRSFTPKSREIVASTVRMAKKLGMHTLAEGVETAEQVEFLKSIGCEKMQGYYFGKPQPFEDSMRHCVERQGLSVETREQNAYFDRLGMVNLQNDRPLLVIDVRNKGDFELLYGNEPSEQLVHDLGYGSARQLAEMIKKSQSLVADKIQTFIKGIDWSENPGKEHTLYITENGHFLSMTFSYIASAGDHHAFIIFPADLSRQEKNSDIQRMDATLRNLLTFYDNVFVVYFDRDAMEVKFQDSFFSEAPGTQYTDLSALVKRYAEKMIYPADQKRFEDFLDNDTLVDRIHRAGSRSQIGQFRVRMGSGEFRWKVFSCMLTPDGYENVGIITMKDSILVDDPDAVKIYSRRFDNMTATGEDYGSFSGSQADASADPERRLADSNHYANMAAIDAAAGMAEVMQNDAQLLRDYNNRTAAESEEERRKDALEDSSVYDNESARQKNTRLRGSAALVLWDNLMNALPINLFWKDAERKYAGVSKNCARSLGMEENELIGKGAWELGSALTGASLDSMEKRVLEGKNIENYPAKLLINGGVHNVLVTESPLYRDGRIDGILGYFIDTEQGRSDQDLYKQAQTFDSVSRCMNSRGIMEALLGYNEQYSAHGIGYDVLVLDTWTWKREVDLYGEDMAVSILARIGETIKQTAGYACFVGRLTDAVFVVIQQKKESSIPIQTLSSRLKNAIEDIHTVDGKDVTLRTNVHPISGNEAPDRMMIRTIDVLHESYKSMIASRG